VHGTFGPEAGGRLAHLPVRRGPILAGSVSVRGTRLMQGLVTEARRVANGMVAQFGLSFGGNTAAMSGLSGTADAAIDLGGPVQASFEAGNIQRLMFGMAGIAGNAFGFTAPPTLAQQAAPAGRSTAARCSGNTAMRRCWSSTVPMTGGSGIEVVLVPGTGHIAASRLPQVLPMMLSWLRAQLAAMQS